MVDGKDFDCCYTVGKRVAGTSLKDRDPMERYLLLV